MIKVQLVGSPLCRRYQRMRTAAINEAKKLGIQLAIKEIGDTETLAQFYPLSLPRLYIQGKLVASQNPPKAEEIARALQLVRLQRGPDE